MAICCSQFRRKKKVQITFIAYIGRLEELHNSTIYRSGIKHNLSRVELLVVLRSATRVPRMHQEHYNCS